MLIMTPKSPSTVAWEDGATDEDDATGEDRGSWRESLQKVSANEQRMDNKLVNLHFAPTETSCTGR